MSAPADAQAFRIDPHAGHPGWMRWDLREKGHFNDLMGQLLVRPGEPGRGGVRMLAPGREHSNLMNTIHGGVILAFIDIALFGGARMAGIESVAGAQTIDCAVQFIAPGRIGQPLDAEVEVLRETGRMVFLRGLVVQEAVTVAAFSGTIRKPSAPR